MGASSRPRWVHLCCRSYYLRRPGAAIRLCRCPHCQPECCCSGVPYSSMTLRHRRARIHRQFTLRRISPGAGTQNSRRHSSCLTCCTDGQLKLRSHPYSPPAACAVVQRQAGTTRSASRREADPSNSNPKLTCPCLCSWCGVPQAPGATV